MEKQISGRKKHYQEEAQEDGFRRVDGPPGTRLGRSVEGGDCVQEGHVALLQILSSSSI